jgi:hypothetical protein
MTDNAVRKALEIAPVESTLTRRRDAKDTGEIVSALEVIDAKDAREATDARDIDGTIEAIVANDAGEAQVAERTAPRKAKVSKERESVLQRFNATWGPTLLPQLSWLYPLPLNALLRGKDRKRTAALAVLKRLKLLGSAAVWRSDLSVPRKRVARMLLEAIKAEAAADIAILVGMVSLGCLVLLGITLALVAPSRSGSMNGANLPSLQLAAFQLALSGPLFVLLTRVLNGLWPVLRSVGLIVGSLIIAALSTQLPARVNHYAAFACGSVGMLAAYALLLRGITYVADWPMRRLIRRFPEAVITRTLVEILGRIRTEPDAWAQIEFRARLARAFELPAFAVERSIIRVFNAGDLVTNLWMRDQAARAAYGFRHLKRWVLTPRAETRDELMSVLRRTLIGVMNGHLDSLPATALEAPRNPLLGVATRLVDSLWALAAVLYATNVSRDPRLYVALLAPLVVSTLFLRSAPIDRVLGILASLLKVKT